MKEETKNPPSPASGSHENPEGNGGLTFFPERHAEGASGKATKDSFPRRIRLSIEGAWKESTKLAETILDTLVVPSGGFSAVAFGWLTSLFFFAISVAVGAVIGIGGLVLFVGLECLALLAYAYPGALFLLSVAGGIAPPLIAYWLLHTLLGIEGRWTTWGAYPLLLVGLFGSYHYWRFGRVIQTTGEGALAFYRGAGPKANEIFGAPFAIFSGIWDVLKLVMGLFRAVAREFFSLFSRPDKATHDGSAAKVHTPPTPKAKVKTEDEGGAGE
jgi:hypothetical protein